MTNELGHKGRIFADRYQLLDIAGKGGMATVWRGVMRWAEGFFRQVAVKLILPSLTENRNFVEMFIEEARVGSQLQHPNIVQILDFGREDTCYFLVMEWVDGLDLHRFVESHKIRRKPLAWPLIAAIGIEALRGLDAAHRRIDHFGNVEPVVHRDVTPQNLLIGANGVIKLTDFGLSRAKDRARLTDPNVVKGKLSYLAPEVAWGKAATPQSDLYCLGLVLLEALLGRKVYAGKSDIEIFRAAREADTPDLRKLRSDIPCDFADVLDLSLQKDLESRYQSAEQMLRGFTRVLRNYDANTDAPVLSRTVIDGRKALGMPPTSTLPKDLLEQMHRDVEKRKRHATGNEQGDGI